MSYGVALRNGVPFTLGTIAALCTNATGSAWTPLALWPDGILSPGMWISPRDLTSQWQYYTGTTPVATPGTVADSSNPVGLAYDLRSGSPVPLGPELVVNGDFSNGATGWTLPTGFSISGGQMLISGAGQYTYATNTGAVSSGKIYDIVVDVASCSGGEFRIYQLTPLISAAGVHTFRVFTTDVYGIWVYLWEPAPTVVINSISVREVPGNHMLQSTSSARPLMSARVNLLQYTEDFTNGYWLNATATVTPNYGTAPDGTQTSTRLQFAGANLAILEANILSSNTPSTASCWIKGPVGETLQLDASLGAGNLVTLTGAWQRATCPHAAGQSFVIGTYGGATARDIEVWHPQFELGLDATDYQAVLSNGSTYATDFPIFQKYDGVDDGMATAAFSAGTLTSAMDCMIAVRRGSAASCVAGLYNGIADATKFFGMAESASGSGCVGSGAGTPTVWVDNTQLTGGTAVTRGTLHTALTVGDWHILEFRNLDLSTWTAAGFGLYTSYVFPGPRGDIMLYPSTTSTEDKDAARQYLADYYGVTLP